MPRVTFVKKARKKNPVCKKGESYYWWKFRYGGKRYSLTRPRASQLTRSAYFGTIYAMQEEIEDWSGDDSDEFDGLKESIQGQVEELGQETQDSLDNMPESLQYSPTGELLQERIDALEGADSELDCIDEFDFDEEEFVREPFDDDEEYASDEERDEAEADHEREQDELESDHEQDQLDEHQNAFDSWLEEAKGVLTEALDNAII